MSKFELKTGEDSEKEDAIEEFIGGLFAREGIPEEFSYTSPDSSFGKEEGREWYGIFCTAQNLLSFLYGFINQSNAVNDLVITELRISTEDIIIHFKLKKKEFTGIGAVRISQQNSDILFERVFDNDTSKVTGFFPERHRLEDGEDQIFIRTHQEFPDVSE